MTYQEKLKDPRWQKKRLKILERDDWACQKCFDTESTLHIHHRYYRKCEPWEYPDDALVTLCENCHEEEKESRPIYEHDLLKRLRLNFLAEDVNILTEGFHSMPILHCSNVVASAYSWALKDKKVQKELIERYFKSLKGNKIV
jgi:hypothetical protein